MKIPGFVSVEESSIPILLKLDDRFPPIKWLFNVVDCANDLFITDYGFLQVQDVRRLPLG